MDKQINHFEKIYGSEAMMPLHVLWARSNKPQLLPITSFYLTAVQLFIMVTMTKKPNFQMATNWNTACYEI